MSVVLVKRGDVGVLFTDQLLANGEPIPLDDTTVMFLVRKLGAAVPSVEEEATIEDASEGQVSYTSEDGDLDVRGFHLQEWEIRYPSGDVFTVPSATHNVIHVTEDLNQAVGS